VDHGGVRALTTKPRGIIAIAAGMRVSCAVVDGTTYCWGGGVEGYGPNPTRIRGIAQPPTAVLVGYAISGGKLLSWNKDAKATPVAGLPPGVTAISVGDRDTCVLAGGQGYCWGRNSFGQLGDGTTTDATSPVQVQGVPGPLDAIAAGTSTCALSAGAVYCWGENWAGQLGDGTTVNSLVPVKVQGLPATATAIVAGAEMACALAGGSVYCWGDNSSGKLGDGTKISRNSAALVPGLSGVTALSTNEGHTCALAGGSVSCWGVELCPYDQTVVSGIAPYCTSPVPVPLPAAATAISTGATHACALANGAMYCWGESSWGQLGPTTTTIGQNDPVEIDFSTVQ